MKKCAVCGSEYKTNSAIWGPMHRKRDVCINCKKMHYKKFNVEVLNK